MIEQSIAPNIVTLKAKGKMYDGLPPVILALTTESDKSYFGYDQDKRDRQERQYPKLCWEKMEA
jgi:hypothetical protein